jgi:hypothetical protein
MHAELIRDWHPLDHTPAPDYIPPAWDGPHVGKRLAEGLRTLRLMPAVKGPRAFGNAWPEWMVEWEDQLAQMEQEQAEQERAHKIANRTRILPSSMEIMRMEASISWPAHYIGDFPQLLRVVQAVAYLRARHRDMQHAARKLDLPGRLVRRWNRQGLDEIAHGLVYDRVRIF